MSIVFFIDTNFFIQGADPNAMPWGEITDAAEIVLIISRPVQEELDRQKGEGKGRRGRRARAASSLMGEILDTPDLSKEIRSNNPRIIVRLDDLDPDVPIGSSDDDRIVQAAISYADSHPISEVKLISADTGPCLSARARKFPHHRLKGAWLAPPEPDPMDREVEELKRRVSALEEDEPKFDVDLTDHSGNALTIAAVETTSFRDLTDREIDDLSFQVESIFPKQTNFKNEEPRQRPDFAVNMFARGVWVAPSEDAIRRYQQEYDKWLTKVRTRLPEILVHERHRANRLPHFLALRNSGGAYAHEVVVELSLSSGLAFYPEIDDDGHGTSLLGPAPAAPKGRYRSLLSPVDLPSHLLHPRDFRSITDIFPRSTPRDRHALYLATDFDRPCAKLEYRCDSFRHKAEGGKFTLDIRPAAGSDVRGGRLVVRVDSRSTEPAEFSFPIKVNRREGNSFEMVRASILRSLQT